MYLKFSRFNNSSTFSVYISFTRLVGYFSIIAKEVEIDPLIQSNSLLPMNTENANIKMQIINYDLSNFEIHN